MLAAEQDRTGQGRQPKKKWHVKMKVHGEFIHFRDQISVNRITGLWV